MSLHRNRFVRQIQVRPRLFLSTALGLTMMALLPHSVAQSLTARMLIAWNIGVWAYVALVAVMVARSSSEKMRYRAKIEDEGQLVILGLVIAAAVASLAAIVAELAQVKELGHLAKLARIGLAVGTILSSWVFTHLMFALHYAHDYYLTLGKDPAGGLSFPGPEAPDYGDFIYFAFVIGTSGQTADVAFTSSAMRRIGLIHCVLAFLFNTTLLALTINIAASLL